MLLISQSKEIKSGCSLDVRIRKQILLYFGPFMLADAFMGKTIMLSKMDGGETESTRGARQRTRTYR